VISLLRSLLQPDSDLFRKRINRAPSPVLALGIPWVSVILSSCIPATAVIASAPILPPFGFLAFIAWRQLHPGLLPVWAGLPLGLIDDLYSGQPLGSAILLWSLAMILIEVVEARIPWRSFVLEWALATALIVAYICLSLAAANAGGGQTPLSAVFPQIVMSVLIYPLVGRIVAMLDRVRLVPIVDLG